MTNLIAALVLVLCQFDSTLAKERVEKVSKDMVAVVEEDFSQGKIKSNISMHHAFSMLAAAATIESGLRESVELCKVNGDGGRSIGLGQVMQGPNWEGKSKKDICGNRKLQLQLSLHVIDRCWAVTPEPAAAFRCYTAGDHRINSSTAKKEFELYKKIFVQVEDLPFSYKKI